MKVEFNAGGWFRIHGDTKVGEATIYEGVAHLEENGKHFVAFTQYYSGDIPPDMIEVPLEVVPVKGAEPSVEAVFSRIPDQEVPDAKS